MQFNNVFYFIAHNADSLVQSNFELYNYNENSNNTILDLIINSKLKSDIDNELINIIDKKENKYKLSNIMTRIRRNIKNRQLKRDNSRNNNDAIVDLIEVV